MNFECFPGRPRWRMYWYLLYKSPLGRFFTRLLLGLEKVCKFYEKDTPKKPKNHPNVNPKNMFVLQKSLICHPKSPPATKISKKSSDFARGSKQVGFLVIFEHFWEAKMHHKSQKNEPTKHRKNDSFSESLLE